MKKYLTELIDSNWFFVSLVAFVIVLPLSVALVSVLGALVLFTALIEDSWNEKRKRIKERKVILLIPIIFLIYLISTLITLKYDSSFYDVKKTMFYVVFPLAFSMGKNINAHQKRFVFYAFAVSVLLAIIIALLRWKSGYYKVGAFGVHNISLISHIRFSFQLVLIVLFFTISLFYNYKWFSKQNLFFWISAIFIYTSYLLFQQSLTGLLALGVSVIFLLLYLFNLADTEWKIPLVVVFILAVIVPFLYLDKAVKNFYDIEKVNPDEIEKTTSLGHKYSHDFSNKLVENGHYVFLYICTDEMREEWNKISEFKYDSIGQNGYPVSATLIRYMTSKGLRKDANGIKALTKADIINVEHGIANVIFTQKYSLYPRVYLTIWEYYVYSITGDSNNKSFSQRIDYAKAALTIIKKKGLFGVGTGKWKAAFAESFNENHSQLDQSNYASSHNQYLNYMVKFGITGFVLIMFLIIYPVIKTKRYRDPLFFLFLLFMFFVNFADSNLESHMGSSFFFFFYCFFLTGPEDYHLIKEKSKATA